MIGAIASS